jgi:hypothetical protein
MSNGTTSATAAHDNEAEEIPSVLFNDFLESNGITPYQAAFTTLCE